MRMSFASNIRDVERDLSDAARRQLPFATSVALNDTVADVQKNETRRLSKQLDRPTPFTKRAYAIRRASKRRLVATVYARRIQAAYLSKQEDGGVNKPKGRAIVLPQKIRTNRYGNIAKGGVKRQLARSDTFSGTPKGAGRGPGIYKRRGSKLTKLVSYTSRTRYKPRLGFRKSAERTATIRFPHHFTRALTKAWRSRR